jgi:hypothetical protein
VAQTQQFGVVNQVLVDGRDERADVEAEGG